jgi:hypothetical protein
MRFVGEVGSANSIEKQLVIYQLLRVLSSEQHWSV